MPNALSLADHPQHWPPYLQALFGSKQHGRSRALRSKSSSSSSHRPAASSSSQSSHHSNDRLAGYALSAARAAIVYAAAATAVQPPPRPRPRPPSAVAPPSRHRRVRSAVAEAVNKPLAPPVPRLDLAAALKLHDENNDEDNVGGAHEAVFTRTRRSHVHDSSFRSFSSSPPSRKRPPASTQCVSPPVSTTQPPNLHLYDYTPALSKQSISNSTSSPSPAALDDSILSDGFPSGAARIYSPRDKENIPHVISPLNSPKRQPSLASPPRMERRPFDNPCSPRQNALASSRRATYDALTMLKFVKRVNVAIAPKPIEQSRDDLGMTAVAPIPPLAPKPPRHSQHGQEVSSQQRQRPSRHERINAETSTKAALPPTSTNATLASLATAAATIRRSVSVSLSSTPAASQAVLKPTRSRSASPAASINRHAPPIPTSILPSCNGSAGEKPPLPARPMLRRRHSLSSAVPSDAPPVRSTGSRAHRGNHSARSEASVARGVTTESKSADSCDTVTVVPRLLRQQYPHEQPAALPQQLNGTGHGSQAARPPHSARSRFQSRAREFRPKRSSISRVLAILWTRMLKQHSASSNSSSVAIAPPSVSDSPTLPAELLVHVLSFLSPPELHQASTVCRLWALLSDEDGVWSQLFQQYHTLRSTKVLGQASAIQPQPSQQAPRRVTVTHLSSWNALVLLSAEAKHPDKRSAVAGETVSDTGHAPSGFWRTTFKSVRKWEKGGFDFMPLRLHSDASPIAALDVRHSHVVTGSENGEAFLWHVSPGDRAPRGGRRGGFCNAYCLSPSAALTSADAFHGHGNAVRVSAVGDRIAVTGSADKQLKVWDLQHGVLLRTLRGHNAAITCLQSLPATSAWAADERFVSGSHDHTIKLWSSKTTRPIASLSGHSNVVLNVSTIDGGAKLLSASRDGTVRLWDTIGAWNTAHNSAMAVFDISSPVAVAAAEAPAGAEVVVADINGRTAAAAGVNVGPAVIPQEVRSAAWGSAAITTLPGADDGKFSSVVLAASYCAIHIFDARIPSTLDAAITHRGNRIATLSGHRNWVRQLTVRDDHTLISASNDSTLRLWDLRSPRQALAVLRGHQAAVNGFELSPSGAEILSVSDDKTVRVWDLVGAPGACNAVLTGHKAPILAIKRGPDDSFFTTSRDGVVGLWA